jgi:hypothetical protein
VNETELLARFRDEIPLPACAPIEHSVMTAIRVRNARRAARIARPWRLAGMRTPRLILAGTVATALGVTALALGPLSGHRGSPAASRPVAWSGRPTAAWPARPSYGRASTEAQLIAYVTHAAAATPGRPPKPNEWIVVKSEYADYYDRSERKATFGPPRKFLIVLKWYRFGQHCAQATVPSVPASTPPTAIVSGKLWIDYNIHNAGCVNGAQLDGWKSVSYSYLNSLPTDPAALEAIMLAAERQYSPHAARDPAIFDSIDSLLTYGYWRATWCRHGCWQLSTASCGNCPGCISRQPLISPAAAALASGWRRRAT